MTFPTVHLNGTGRAGLREQYCEVAGALRKTLDTMSQNGPHGRDYYVQPGDAISEARKEHKARMDKVRSVLGEIEEILDHLYE